MAILIIWATAFVLLAGMGGGIVVWSVCLAAIAAAVAWALIPAGEPRQPTRVHLTLFGALAGIVILMALTLIPLPDFIVGLAGEPRASQHREVVAALNAAGNVGMPAAGRPVFALTRNYAGTARMLALLLAAISMAALAARMDAAGRQRLLTFLSLAGMVVAITGYISQHLIPQGDTLLWWLPIQHALPGPIACFGNRNHFAGFLAMLSIAAFAACVQGALRKNLADSVLHGSAFCTMAIVLTLTMSRGALLAWSAGLAVVFVLGLARRPLVVAIMALLVLAAAAGTFMALPKLPVPERYKSLARPFDNSSAETRLSAWRDSLRIWSAYPVSGAGANSYRTVFPQHRRSMEGAFATYPENLYVQILAETGTAGACLSLVLMAAGAMLAWRRWRGSDTDRSTAIAGIGAVTVVLVHGVVDMPLQIPLYAVTAGTLAGLLLIPAPEDTAPASLPRFRLGLAVPAVLVAAFIAFHGGRVRLLDAPTFLEYASVRDTQRALVWAPSSWHAWYYLGRNAFMIRKPGAAEFGAQCMARAGACDPNNYRLWKNIGEMRLNMGDIDGARAAFNRVRELRSWVAVPTLPEPRP